MTFALKLPLILSFLILGLSSIFLGIYGLIKNNRVRAVQLWFFLSIVIFSGSYGFIWSMLTSGESSFYSFKLVYLAASIGPVVFFHFVCSLLGLENKNRLFIIIGYILGSFVTAIVLFSYKIIAGVVQRGYLGFREFPGELHIIFLIYFFTYFLLSAYVLLREFPKSEGIRRQRITALLWAFLLMVVAAESNFLSTYFYLYPFGQLFVFLYPFFIARGMHLGRLDGIQ